MFALLVACSKQTSVEDARQLNANANPIQTTAPIITAAQIANAREVIPIRVGVVAPAPGVSSLPKNCTSSNAETCNARDDDCDGKIDEDCNYGSGRVRVILSWNTGADVDLYVEDPLGETVSFSRPQTPAGGQMIRSGRGACEPDLPDPRVESIRWLGDDPPRGAYQVTAHYWGECGVGTGTAEVTVVAQVDDVWLGPYTRRLKLGERALLMQFEVRSAMGSKAAPATPAPVNTPQP